MKVNDFINIAMTDNYLRTNLINKLPDKRLYELTSNLIIETNKYKYLVKIRNIISKNDIYEIDIEATEERIKALDFIELSNKSYKNIEMPKDITEWQELMKTTDSLIHPGDNILFRMNIDI